jgi:alpha-beta hydrolase superfamily lysophospholipase
MTRQLTTPDGKKLYLRQWPSEKTKAIVALVHGLGEHSGRYEHVARYLNENGYALAAFDQRGHGHSGGKRGHFSSIEQALDDIGLFLEEVKKEYPDLPLFLYGHSMGGNLSLNYLLRRKPDITGAIITGPWIRLPSPPSPLLLAFARLMSRVYPSFCNDNGLKTAHLSHDPAVVKAYEEDPLVHSKITAGAFVLLSEAAQWLESFRGEVPAPVLLMHGEADQITGADGSKAFARHAGGPVEYRGWPELYHEIHNEPEQAEVLEFIVEWLNKHLQDLG